MSTPHTDPVPVAPPAARPPRLEGVLRTDGTTHEGDEPKYARFGTLYEAQLDLPRTPEAEIRGMGGILATCAPFEAKWHFTPLGRARLQFEIGGDS